MEVIHALTFNFRRMLVWPLFILPLVIYFHPFSEYSDGQTMLLQESFENHMPSEALSKPQAQQVAF